MARKIKKRQVSKQRLEFERKLINTMLGLVASITLGGGIVIYVTYGNSTETGGNKVNATSYKPESIEVVSKPMRTANITVSDKEELLAEFGETTGENIIIDEQKLFGYVMKVAEEGSNQMKALLKTITALNTLKADTDWIRYADTDYEMLHVYNLDKRAFITSHQNEILRINRARVAKIERAYSATYLTLGEEEQTNSEILVACPVDSAESLASSLEVGDIIKIQGQAKIDNTGITINATNIREITEYRKKDEVKSYKNVPLRNVMDKLFVDNDTSILHSNNITIKGTIASLVKFEDESKGLMLYSEGYNNVCVFVKINKESEPTWLGLNDKQIVDGTSIIVNGRIGLVDLTDGGSTPSYYMFIDDAFLFIE